MFQNVSSKLRFINNFKIIRSNFLYKFPLRVFATNTSEFVVTLKSFEEFDKEVMKSKLPVLIDFYADWCAPCRKAAPILESKANEKKIFKLVKINIDNHPELSEQFQVQGIPYLVLMKEGKKVGEMVGFNEIKLNIMISGL